MSGSRLPDEIETRRLAFEAALSSMEFPEHTPELYDPVRYVLKTRGKRIRPLLVLLTAGACGGEEAFDRAMPAAMAVELFHAFTLVHDDIMDAARTRRGRETVHVRWDASTAILTGDFLFGLAYNQLRQTPGLDLVEAGADFHETVASLCEGQALDMAFASRSDGTLEDYLAMIDRKTAALLAFCLSVGGRVGGADSKTRGRLHRAGIALGRAFQIQDDLLDVTAVSASWGKTIGGDLMEGKRTFLLLCAIEQAEGEDRRFFMNVLDEGIPESDVEQTRERMEQLGVLDHARDAVSRHVEKARDILRVLPESEGRALLFALIHQLARRGH